RPGIDPLLQRVDHLQLRRQVAPLSIRLKLVPVLQVLHEYLQTEEGLLLHLLGAWAPGALRQALLDDPHLPGNALKGLGQSRRGCRGRLAVGGCRRAPTLQGTQFGPDHLQPRPWPSAWCNGPRSSCWPSPVWPTRTSPRRSAWGGTRLASGGGAGRTPSPT